jgi:hypothetical protein
MLEANTCDKTAVLRIYSASFCMGIIPWIFLVLRMFLGHIFDRLECVGLSFACVTHF